MKKVLNIKADRIRSEIKKFRGNRAKAAASLGMSLGLLESKLEYDVIMRKQRPSRILEKDNKDQEPLELPKGNMNV